MIEIYFTPQFEKMYRRLPDRIKILAEQKEHIFRLDPFDSRLRTHKLLGQLHDYFAFSIDYHYRIIFSFESNSKVYFHAIGTHQVYQR